MDSLSSADVVFQIVCVVRTVLKDAKVDSTCMHNDQCCALNSHTYSMYWGILKYMHSKRRKGLAAYDMWPLELNDMVTIILYIIIHSQIC